MSLLAVVPKTHGLRMQRQAKFCIRPVSLSVLTVMVELFFCGNVWHFVAPLAPSKVIQRTACRAGTEAVDDADMVKKMREWKKSRGKSASSPSPAASPAPTPAPVPATAPASTAARGFADKPMDTPIQVQSEAAAAPAVSPAAATRTVTARDAVSELLERAQKNADPNEMTPQQLIMVFFTFFSGWRQRHGIPGEMELTPKQKQIVILMVQTALSTVGAARDFWPMVCAELGSAKDQETKELLFALTGMHE